MKPDDVLSTTELQVITGHARPTTQAAKLARMGVPFRFTGRAVVVERVAATVHELLPNRPADGAPRIDLVRR